MKKQFLKALEAKTVETVTKVNEVNENSFFTENNVNGFKSTESLANYFYASSNSERYHLDLALEAISDGAKLNGILSKSFDKKDGHEIIWLSPSFPNADLPPLRVLFDEDILRFFKTYQKGELRFNINLEKLLIIAGVIPVEEQA